MAEETPKTGLDTSGIPPDVDVSTISDSTIGLFGLDRDRVKQLKELNSLEALQKKGGEFYRQFKQDIPSTDFTLEIDDDLKFKIPGGTTLDRIPEIIMTDFQQHTPTPETATERQRLNSWFSGCMETAFEAKDWGIVYPTAEFSNQGLEILTRLKRIVSEDFYEGLRIAQAYENFTKKRGAEVKPEAADQPYAFGSSQVLRPVEDQPSGG